MTDLIIVIAAYLFVGIVSLYGLGFIVHAIFFIASLDDGTKQADTDTAEITKQERPSDYAPNALVPDFIKLKSFKKVGKTWKAEVIRDDKRMVRQAEYIKKLETAKRKNSEYRSSRAAR